jgi:hypothetical protein
MKTLLLLFLAPFLATLCQAIELKALPHQVVHDQRTFIRDATDRRYSVWTDDDAKAAALFTEFRILEDFQLPKGKILALFFNDRITEDLVQITFNTPANNTFADYADSGIEFKLRAAPEGKKYSHLTAVVFTPEHAPSHLGVRGMVMDGLSDKK